jgi:hemolysin III
VALFGASTIYHAVYREYQTFWQKVDHIAIYFLIAGSYTPVGLTVLYNSSGVYLLIAVWGLALVGLLYKLFFIHRWPRFSLFLYLAMGWLVVFEFNSVQESFSEVAMNNLIIGGILYTTGVLFYRWYQWQWHHVVWHLFVLGGAFFHYLMVVEILSQMNYL